MCIESERRQSLGGNKESETRKCSDFPTVFRCNLFPLRSKSGVKLSQWFCKERAVEVWTPLIWPEGPAAAGCTCHHMKRRGHTTVGGAKPQETGGKMSLLRFVTTTSGKTLELFYQPNTVLVCDQSWHLLKKDTILWMKRTLDVTVEAYSIQFYLLFSLK